MNPRHFLHAQHKAIRRWAVRGPWSGALFEFISFGIKQAWACLFGGLMLALLLGTFLWYPQDAALARYDLRRSQSRSPWWQHVSRLGKKCA